MINNIKFNNVLKSGNEFEIDNFVDNRPEPWSHNKKIAVLLITLAILNIFDALCTQHLISVGGMKEFNPLMLSLLKMSDSIFIFAKLFVGFLGIGILWRYRENILVYLLTIPLVMLYTFIGAIHIALLIQYYQ